MALNTTGAISLAGATAGQSIALELGLGTSTQISLNDTAVRTLAGVLSGAIIMPTNFYGKSNVTGYTRVMFAFGDTSNLANYVAITNVTSNTGVVAGDITYSGVTVKGNTAGAQYGGDKGIYAYGFSSSNSNTKNLVSNTGVMAATVAGIGQVREILAGTGYGGDKGIFAFGAQGATKYAVYNLISNTGVQSSDVAGVTTPRQFPSATTYGGDKAVFAYGMTSANISASNKVSNTGVMAADTTGVGTASRTRAGTGYGGDKGIFGYGFTTATVSFTNKVSNTGVVATDTAGVGSNREKIGAGTYGGDKAIFGYGTLSGLTTTNITNKVSNTGVVAGNTAGVGSSRSYATGTNFSNS
jgi:hypothetical protein